MTQQDRENAGWVCVSEMKADGSCHSPPDPEREAPSLSSDNENGETDGTGGTGTIGEKQVKKVKEATSPTQCSFPSDGQRNISPLGLGKSVSSNQSLLLPPSQGDNWPKDQLQKICPALRSLATLPHQNQLVLDPTHAMPRSVDNLLTPSSLNQLFPREEIDKMILSCEEYRDNAYRSGEAKVSDSHSYREIQNQNGQNLTQQQDALAAEYRKFKDPEATDNSKGLDDSDNEYTW